MLLTYGKPVSEWFIKKPLVVVIMGSDSDWEQLKPAVAVLDDFRVPNDYFVISAHRTPDRMSEFMKIADAKGVKIIIAGAGGSAHLPGMSAALSPLPVIGVPLKSELSGMDSALSIGQMPRGIPVGMMPIGKAGPVNAALFAVRMLAMSDLVMKERLNQFIIKQTNGVPMKPDDSK